MCRLTNINKVLGLIFRKLIEKKFGDSEHLRFVIETDRNMS
jgi:hypothetical protein